MHGRCYLTSTPFAFGKWIARTIPCSMVGATLPTAPSVRIANSRQFSMLNRKCDHCLRSSVRVHFVSARPEVRRFLLAKRILYIHYVFLPLFSREQYGPFPCRLRLVFVSSPCLAGRWMLFIYYLPMTAFVRANATQKPFLL